MARFYLNVPFEEKDLAKQKGRNGTKSNGNGLFHREKIQFILFGG